MITLLFLMIILETTAGIDLPWLIYFVWVVNVAAAMIIAQIKEWMK